MRLKNKVAIVTGGSSGIGAGFAERFAQEGATVAIINRAPNENLSRVLKSIKAKGGKVEAFHADISNPTQSHGAIEEIASQFGGIDILINNAGVFLPTPATNTTEEVWDKMTDTNLKGPFFCIQSVIPHMRKRGGGRIINIGSIFGVDGFPGSAAYCAVKGGIGMLTKSLALEFRDDNININCLAPGCIATPLNEDLRKENGEFCRLLQERFNGNPWLLPEDMAGTAVFLATADSAVITGTTIMVDKGWAAY